MAASKKAAGETLVWLSYDLGIQGDYEGLYAWLDRHQAKECGDSLACFKYAHQGDLKSAIKADLSKAFTKSNRTRIYVVYRDAKADTLKGCFLFGARRASPWQGFAEVPCADDEDGE